MADTLRISMVHGEKHFSIDAFDPAKINYLTEWNVAMNLFSRLVSFNAEGELVSGLASKFYWVGDEAHFELRPDFRTIDGHKITPEDAAASFKRLLILSANTHGKLDDFICGATKLKSLADSCEGIRYTDKELILKVTRQNPFLFKALTSADFSIIPKSAVDPKTLKIKDYRNTTGLYYFERYNKDGKMIFGVNKAHWWYSPKIPQQVEMVPEVYGLKDDGEHVADQMLRDRLDVIAKGGAMKVGDFNELDARLRTKNIPHDLALSEPLLLYFLSFTPRGFKLKPEVRFAVLQDIRHLVAKNRGSLGDMGLEPTDYIFPPNGHGALDNDENLKYQDRLVHPIDSKIPSMTIDIAVSAKARGMMEQIFKGGYFHYNLVISPAVRNYSSSSPSDNTVPHLNYANQDIMFEEDISLLSYSFAFSDIFALKAADAESWLRQFKNELDGKTRMTMLRKLHFDSLVTQPAVIPLYTSRMGAMARNGWKMKFPSYTADTLFWYLEKG